MHSYVKKRNPNPHALLRKERKETPLINAMHSQTRAGERTWRGCVAGRGSEPRLGPAVPTLRPNPLGG